MSSAENILTELTKRFGNAEGVSMFDVISKNLPPSDLVSEKSHVTSFASMCSPTGS